MAIIWNRNSSKLLPPAVSPLSESEELKEMSEEEKERSEVSMSDTETVPTSPGPSGLVVFGLFIMKHSYVSALIIMMVNHFSH